MPNAPLILWFRRDLRLDDHPMIAAALATGRPLIPVFIYDTETAALGAAAQWRLGQGIAHFSQTLARIGSRLVLRQGDAGAALTALVAQSGAAGVLWQRMYDPASVARDTGVKAMLRARGLIADSHGGALLIEPWQVETGQGGPYRVYTPFWRNLAGRDFGTPLAAPVHLPAPSHWPDSEILPDMGAAVRRGGAVLARFAQIGEGAALARLARFLGGAVGPYRSARDFMGIDATSKLSENLAWGEISPRRIWADTRLFDGAAGAEHFRKELVWREFAYHLMHHFPHILTRSWREGWDDFPWAGDCPEAEAWRRGRTGEPFVDAAMREVYATGRMHNRARMIAASYLTKHLMVDWRVGQAWFAEVLTDWDAASNAMGWQWVAGCGPDASPFFRVFNPAGQAEKFDADGAYRQRWLGAGADAQAFCAAVPRAWGANTPPHTPIVTLAAGRARALAAYGARKTGAQQDGDTQQQFPDDLWGAR